MPCFDMMQKSSSRIPDTLQNMGIVGLIFDKRNRATKNVKGKGPGKSILILLLSVTVVERLR